MSDEVYKSEKDIYHEKINALIGFYCSIFREQMRPLNQNRIFVKLDLFAETVLLTTAVGQSEGSNENDEMLISSFDEVYQILAVFYFSIQDDDEKLGHLKGYFHLDSQMEISLFYIRCFWIYQNILDENQKEWFGMLMFECPFLKKDDINHLSRLKRILTDYLDNIQPEDFAISNNRKIGEAVSEKVHDYIVKYGQVIKPTTDNKGYDINKLGNDIGEVKKLIILTFLNEGGGKNEDKLDK